MINVAYPTSVGLRCPKRLAARPVSSCAVLMRR